jgi:hypothetical protein
MVAAVVVIAAAFVSDPCEEGCSCACDFSSCCCLSITVVVVVVVITFAVDLVCPENLLVSSDLRLLLRIALAIIIAVNGMATRDDATITVLLVNNLFLTICLFVDI